MNNRLRSGKSSELVVAGELLRHGVDVYLPCVDDQAIDMLLRVEHDGQISHYDVQVKSVNGYNRIVGLKDVSNKPSNHILIIHYRHTAKNDEFFFLTKEQIRKHHLANSAWGDLVFNKAERELYSSQTLEFLAQNLLAGAL